MTDPGLVVPQQAPRHTTDIAGDELPHPGQQIPGGPRRNHHRGDEPRVSSDHHEHRKRPQHTGVIGNQLAGKPQVALHLLAGQMNQPINTLGDFITWIERWQARAAELDAPPVITLEEAKASKNAEINAARADANSRTFPHASHEFACDALSRSDIDGINGYVALNGDFPPQFPGAWKAVDNSYYPLPDVESWKAFYAAMVATGAAHFAHAQELKALLSSATTIEEVEAIVW